MAKMTEKELQGYASNAINAANPEGVAAEEYSLAMDYYHGRMKPNKPGRSQIVSTDVADMTEAVLAQLMPSFTNDQLGAFEALSEDDVKQAEDESVACNHVIMEQNNGYMLFNNSIKNAALKRNAWIGVEVVTTEDIDTKKYTNLTPEALRQLTEDEPPRDGVSVRKEYFDLETEGELTHVRVRTTVTKQELLVRSIDPKYMIADNEHDEHDMQKSRMVGEIEYFTRSDLVERGFDKAKVAKLTEVEGRITDESMSTGNGFNHKASDLIEVYKLWMKIDYDGDGIAERREVWLGGGVQGEILKNEEANIVPYATGVLFIEPNSWKGISLFNKLKNEQDTKTDTVRTWVDGNKTSVYGRYVVIEDEVNYGDIMNAVPGGLIRARSRDAVQALTTIDVGPSAIGLLSYMDKMRTEKGGASLDMQGAETQIVGETARGIDRQFTSKEQLCEMMSQNMAETLLKATYQLVHRTLREHGSTPLIIKRGDEWLNTTPDQWQARDRVNVTLGASVQARDRLMANIEKMIGFSVMLKQAQLATTMQDHQGIYQMIKEWGASANLNNTDAFWIDPSSKRGKEMAKREAERAKQQGQQMAAVQQQMMRFTQQLEDKKIAADFNKLTKEIQFKYFDAWLGAEIEEAKIVGSATIQLETAQQQARALANGNNQTGASDRTA